jgi:hypothetical protein
MARWPRSGPVAEVDGNRTRQTEILGFTGFEDRDAHQERAHLHVTHALDTEGKRIDYLG